MLTLAIIATPICFQIFLREGYSTWDAVLTCLDLITITVPPILPVAMSIGIAYSLSRLSKLKIYSIAPQDINAAGRVNVMVFDKTGTLTEEDLYVQGHLPLLKEDGETFFDNL